MSTVIFPYAYIPDPTKGKPISNGQLFFGLPDLDPEIEANRITVGLQQEDGTIVNIAPASQPILTGAGGVPLYNGSPVVLLVNEKNYSLKVLDKNGQQEYYQENVTSSSIFSQLGDISDAIAAEVGIGSYIQTAEYYDGTGLGGGLYEVVAGGTGTPDGGSFIDMTNGNQLKLINQAGIANPFQFGVLADDPTKLSEFINCINYAISSKLPLDVSSYYFLLQPDQINLSNGDSLRIIGNGKFIGGIRPSSAGNVLFSLSQDANIYLSDMDLDCSSFDCGAISGTSSGSTSIGVQSIRSRISVTGSTTKDGINISGVLQNVLVDSCLFQGNENPSLVGQLFELQRLLSVPDIGSPSGDRNPVIVTNNRFEGGATQFSTFGTDSAISPIHIIGNSFFDAACRSIHLYHGEEITCTNNVVEGCKGKRPTADLNNIGGAVWLDLFSPLVDGSRNDAVYSNNIVKKCSGVGVFVEEYTGTLSGWSVLETDIFPNGYQYVGSEGFVTSGGYGFVIAGGCKRLGLNIRADGNVCGVVVDRTLGVDPSLQVGVIDLSHCHIDENKENGVLLRDQIRQFRMFGGTLVGNSKDASDQFSAILIDRDSSQSLTEARLHDVSFDDRSTTIFHKNCIEKTYPALYLDVDSCTMNSLSEWINSGGTVSGQIKNNRLLDSRGFTLSGTDQWYLNNEGFVTEIRDRETVSNGFLSYAYSMDQSGSRALVSPVDSTTPVIVSLNLLSSALQIRLFDASGNAITGDVDVAINISASKSLQ